MKGYEVLVCSDCNCTFCGEFPSIDVGHWGTVKCGGGSGINGNQVKIRATGNDLHISELHIYGLSAGMFFLPLEKQNSYMSEDQANNI